MWVIRPGSAIRLVQYFERDQTFALRGCGVIGELLGKKSSIGVVACSEPRARGTELGLVKAGFLLGELGQNLGHVAGRFFATEERRARSEVANPRHLPASLLERIELPFDALRVAAGELSLDRAKLVVGERPELHGSHGERGFERVEMGAKARRCVRGRALTEPHEQSLPHSPLDGRVELDGRRLRSQTMESLRKGSRAVERQPDVGSLTRAAIPRRGSG